MGEVASTFNQEDELELKKRKHWKILLLLLAFAFFLRLFLIISPEVIHNDGTEYIRHAKQILSGDWAGGKSPPLYPSLIALVQMITQDYEMAGIWVSVIFGTLIILPVFYLGRVIFDEKIGFLSALLATVHPSLYISSGSVLTESTYHFFLVTSVLLGWYAFSKGGTRHPLLFGLSTALAYLTRPEAIGLLIIFLVWTLVANPSDGKRGLLKKVGIISVAIMSFVAFSFPYLLQIRKDTGRWGLSKKTKVSIGSLSEEEEVPSLEYLRKRKGITLSSIVKHPLPVLGKIGTGLLNSLYKFQQVFNPFLFLLAIVGWVFLFKKKKFYSVKRNLFLLSFLVFFFGLVFPFFFITRRYASQMISLALPWATFGFLEVINWINQRFNREGVGKRVPVVLLICLLIGLFVQGRVIHSREHRFIQREVGLWMKENLPKGSRVMSRLPQEAFYAEFPWVLMPYGEYGVIIEEARCKGVRYLLIDENIEKVSSHFLRNVRREDLVPVRDFKKKGQKVMIFEIVEQD
jgi:4-amino-4-deoxy-L-arabinose transferase-like glycosyltransferase